MTHTEKLLKKKFNIKTEKQFLTLINKKEESFFENSFFISKEKYISNITKLIKEVNDLGSSFKDIMPMAKSGSILNPFASDGLGSIMSDYRSKLKTLENHCSFFKKPTPK